MIIEGTVAPGFESVRQLYQHNMHTLKERNTQLCVYVGQECVVDLWGSAIDDDGFSADSLINVFSSGKSLESILLAMLVDRGLLRFDAKITEYWPEFAANRKGDISVADLMRHESGLAGFDTSLDAEDFHPQRLRTNTIGAVIEQQTPKFRPGQNTQREYHAITRGWIANEVFRRVEPSGRTMGQFLREEVSSLLDIDVYIGLRDHELARISEVVMLGFGYQFIQSLLPKALGRKTDLNLLQIVAKLWRLRSAIFGTTVKDSPIPITGLKSLSNFDSPAISTGEMPSAAAKCSARGLAKLAAVMANGGSLAGQQLLGESAFQALHEAPIRRDMMALNTSFTQGGLATFPPPAASDSVMDKGLNHGREGYFGWFGLGGSIFQWQPQHKIGLAYIPTSLNVLDIVNERGKAYQAEVVACVEKRIAR